MELNLEQSEKLRLTVGQAFQFARRLDGSRTAPGKTRVTLPDGYAIRHAGGHIHFSAIERRTENGVDQYRLVPRRAADRKKHGKEDVDSRREILVVRLTNNHEMLPLVFVDEA